MKSQKLPNQLSQVQYKSLNFFIFDAPSPSNINTYATELKAHNVTDVARVCDPTYDKQILKDLGINIHDWPYADGDCPPPDICAKWLDLVDQRFSKEGGCIGIHCVAGLGR